MPRAFQLTFLAVMLILAAALGWLGWRLLEQDRELSAQRLAERRETAADLAAAALEKHFSAIEQDLSRILSSDETVQKILPAEGSILVDFRPTAVRAWPPERLVYYPGLPEVPEIPAEIFAASDALEFTKLDYPAAMAALQAPTTSATPAIQAGALVRLARMHLKQGEAEKALRTYQRLGTLGAAPVGGMPAALAASSGALVALERQGQPAGSAQVARALQRDLDSGRWRIGAATYHYLREQAVGWLGDADSTPAPRIALAEGAEWLWEKWRRETSLPSGGRVSPHTPSGSALIVWRRSGTAVAGFVATAEYVRDRWLPGMKPLLDGHGVRLALVDAEGRYALGSAPEHGIRPAIRLSPVTQLPWTVQVSNAPGSNSMDPFRFRRQLLIAGLCVLVALILIGGSAIGHAVDRSLAVARLQSEFVSSVSHEFRTPLTTLCQLSEMLMRGRLTGDQECRESYALLHKESDRLRRLVEGLLNFGRLEAGKMQLRFETVDAAALVRQSAAEFAGGQQARGHRLEVAADAETVAVRADHEALRCALWNLFDNAVKYSPDCDTVWVEAGRNGRNVVITVRDRGAGIARSEQKRIFRKFVRGSAARGSEVGGTGIGLATARQIVRAHGGEITVDSEPGRGSAFRILLPGLGS